MRQDIDRIKTEFLPQRRDFLYNRRTVGNGGPIPNAQPDIAALPHSQRNIKFGTIEYAPASGNQDQEYIQIINQNSFAVDISRWRLEGGVRFTFTPGTVIPAGGILYVSPDVVAFLKQYETTLEINNKFLAHMRDTGGKPPQGAMWFLKTYENLWTQWVSADVAAKVKAAM